MDKRLHMLESFHARGDDGGLYTVCGYEQLARLDGMPPDCEWQPTGQCEYRLATGEPVSSDRTGAMTILGRGIRLRRESGTAAAWLLQPDEATVYGQELERMQDA